MKHYGDITKLHGYELPAVDVIVGGSPCQDLSVAGNRAGLGGERSGLFMEQIRLVKEMRERDRLEGRPAHLCRPRYMVWENVPGAFSSNGGEDFRIVLEEICKVCDESAYVPRLENGRWTKAGCIVADWGSVSWRVHDAQFWGVPQRRKRISLVADFGGLSAPEILFERKGLSRDPQPCGEAGEGAAAGTESGSGRTISFQERAGKPGGAKEPSYRMSTSELCPPSTTSPSSMGFDGSMGSKAGNIGFAAEQAITTKSTGGGTA